MEKARRSMGGLSKATMGFVALIAAVSQIPPFNGLTGDIWRKVGQALSQTWDDILAAGERTRPRDVTKANDCISNPIAAASACRAAAIACCEDLEDLDVISHQTRGKCRRVRNTRTPYGENCATLCGDMITVCAEAGVE